MPGRSLIIAKGQGTPGAYIKILCIVEFSRYRTQLGTSTVEAHVGVICECAESIVKLTREDLARNGEMQKNRRIERMLSLTMLSSR